MESRNLKRIRQACASCRRRKSRCSGERPVCLQCRRTRNSCVYEPYSVTPELLQRISLIESRLAELSSPAAPPPSLELTYLKRLSPESSGSLNALPTFMEPPRPILLSVIDAYFEHAHNQPYSYFHERAFRDRLLSNNLPRCLLLAVLAAAVRFSTDEFYAGRTLEASEIYAREAWLAVLRDELTSEDNPALHVVQTANILAVVDYTAGRVNSGWIKIGLAARVSQVIGLMDEPSIWLPPVQQEERRRTFWSIYLLDKLISCGRNRPLMMHDRDCHVLLPCREDALQDTPIKWQLSLHELLDWNAQLTDEPSPFAMTILMASIVGRCTRYLCSGKDETAPWDMKSEYSCINALLLLLESHVKTDVAARLKEMAGGVQGDEHILRMQQETLNQHIFAQVLFHLCHCLLNHPFFLHNCFRPYRSKVPRSFATRAIQTAVDHATLLVQLLQSASEVGVRTESSFYTYSIAVAGGILSLASNAEHSPVNCQRSDMLDNFKRTVGMLDRLARIWPNAANMATRLRDFHAKSQYFSSLLNPVDSTSDLDPASVEILWSILEYAVLGAAPSTNSPGNSLDMLSFLSPTQWGLPSDPLPVASPENVDAYGIFRGTTPLVRLNEIERLLNSCSPRSGML
ncbi:hypothetical protein BJY00DRAFT_299973 [Aspergillus carlsbadensis]|nr:hypothetical protein BJY00DRAFT_299973 [Aspergillus carlsbadensis]